MAPVRYRKSYFLLVWRSLRARKLAQRLSCLQLSLLLPPRQLAKPLLPLFGLPVRSGHCLTGRSVPSRSQEVLPLLNREQDSVLCYCEPGVTVVGHPRCAFPVLLPASPRSKPNRLNSTSRTPRHGSPSAFLSGNCAATFPKRSVQRGGARIAHLDRSIAT